MRPTSPTRPLREAGPLRSTDPPPRPPAAPAWKAVARGTAAFFGAFFLLELASETLLAATDANLWWLDLRPLDPRTVRAGLGLAGVLLVGFALHPRLPGPLHAACFLTVAGLIGAALWHAAGWVRLLAAGRVVSSVPVPFDVHVAACLFVVLAGLCVDRRRPHRPVRDAIVGVVSCAVCAAAFAAAQMVCRGRIDQRGPADAALVFGAKVLPDGRPTTALADRVRTACGLHEAGLVRTLVLSGGPGPGDVSETEAMRRLAVAEGVPARDLLLDADGIDTRSTVRRAAERFGGSAADPPALDPPRSATVLAVSHSWHLPRIRLLARRSGLEVRTVPCAEPVPLANPSRMWGREALALGWHVLTSWERRDGADALRFPRD
jgi:vancomycin permeability regulator SanA